jgi:predicted ATPase/transcriptional regulator with XRE-family HTH domain
VAAGNDSETAAVAPANFGSYLRDLRIEQKLSQSELAERASMSVEAISALERGFRKRPQAGTIDLLSAALALDRDRLLTFRDLSRAAPRAIARVVSAASPSEGGANNLPLPLTSFIGRENEVAAIVDCVASRRLVTLVGSGGIGKTRTLLQVAATRLDRAREDVWFVELAPLTSGEFLITTIAQAMKLSLRPSSSALEDLVRALTHRTCFLLLDNCEHIVDAVSAVVAAIVRVCPGVRVLATSRQPLGVVGESVFRMPPLPVPQRPREGPQALTAAEARASAAVSLFIERAHESEPRFALTDENAGIIAAICERLDGIPLAIELAAPRVKIFTPSQLLARLDERFRLLIGDKRNLLPRQQTLRALIDWSYDLLGEAERTMFRALGIFAGGFALDAAVAVVAPELDEFAAVDVLAALTDKSLVLAEDAGDDKRFRLLESTHAYAREKLEGAREREAVAQRHLEYLRDLFQASVAERERTGNGAAHEGLFATELDNVRVAADFALSGAHVASGAEMLVEINGISWTHVGHGSEGLARLQAFRDVLGADRPALVARLCAWIAVLARELGRRELAGEASAMAVTSARASGDPVVLATALARHANTMVSLERLDDARSALAEAESHPVPSAMQQRRILEARANLARLAGDVGQAVRTWEMMRDQLRFIGDLGDERVATVCLSECEFQRGNTARAIDLLEEIVPSARGAADWGLYVRILYDLGAYHIAIGANERAETWAREAIRLAAERDRTSTHLVAGLEILALLQARGGDDARAARIARFTIAADAAIGARRDFVAASVHDQLQRALGPARGEAMTSVSALLTVDEAVALALA